MFIITTSAHKSIEFQFISFYIFLYSPSSNRYSITFPKHSRTTSDSSQNNKPISQDKKKMSRIASSLSLLSRIYPNISHPTLFPYSDRMIGQYYSRYYVWESSQNIYLGFNRSWSFYGYLGIHWISKNGIRRLQSEEIKRIYTVSNIRIGKITVVWISTSFYTVL